MALVTHLLRVTIELMTAWNLWRVIRAITQVILRIAIAALVTRTLRRVIVHLVTPIPLAVITDITARYFVRWICAMS